jgi:hypothetical protein
VISPTTRRVPWPGTRSAGKCARTYDTLKTMSGRLAAIVLLRRLIVRRAVVTYLVHYPLWGRPRRVRPGDGPSPVHSSGTQGPLREPERSMARRRPPADELLRVRFEVLVEPSRILGRPRVRSGDRESATRCTWLSPLPDVVTRPHRRHQHRVTRRAVQLLERLGYRVTLDVAA